MCLHSASNCETRFQVQRDPRNFERFIREPAFAKLVTNVGAIGARMSLSEDFVTLLSGAREARNYIAHEAPANLDEILATGDTQEWRSTVDTKIREVALGKLVLAMLLPRVCLATSPDRVERKTYVDQVAAWVLGQ